MPLLTNAAAKVADAMLGKREVAQGSTQPEVSPTETMRAIVWKGPKQVACERKPVPCVTHPKDVVVRVTQCTVCSGSDSHIYCGEIPTTDDGLIMGHEACGVVHQVGPEVTKFQPGDRVVIAFNIACGECARCARQEFTGCDRTNDSKLFEEMYGGPAAGAIYGYSRLMGNVPGSQAEFVRVPFADVNLCPIPDSVPDEKALFVSDVLCTSLHAVEMGCVREGDTVAIWGLGPIGLYAAQWAKLKGAARVINIDLVPERIALARNKFGLDVLDRSNISSNQVLGQLRSLFPDGVDVAIDATGFRFSQSWTSTVERALGMQTDTPDILLECMMTVRKFGHVSIIADYIGNANHFPIGHIMMKHLTVRSGQCPVQRYFKYVMKKLEQGAIDPTLMVTHRLSLEEVPHAYEQLFYKKDGYLKVLISTEERPRLPAQQEGIGASMPQVNDAARQYAQGQQDTYHNGSGATLDRAGLPSQPQQQQQQQQQRDQQPSMVTRALEALNLKSSSNEPSSSQQPADGTATTAVGGGGLSQYDQQKLQQQEEPASMYTRAKDAMNFKGSNNDSSSVQQPGYGAATTSTVGGSGPSQYGQQQQQQQYNSHAQAKTPFVEGQHSQQPHESYGHGQQLQSNEPTHTYQGHSAYRGSPP